MSIENYMLPCLNKSLFGFECMGCGFQRSLVAVFQGQFHQAFVLYPAIFPIITMFVLIVITRFYKFKYHQKSINVVALISIGAIITNHIIKQFLS